MVLQVYGQPVIVDGDRQEIKAVYGGKRRDITEIFIDADLVTVGLVAKALDDIYRDGLKKLLPEHADEIETTIEGVLKHGQNRS